MKDVRLNVATHDLRFDALEERVETIREGTVSAIGYAANASRAHVDLHRQIADLTRRVEKLEAGANKSHRAARCRTVPLSNG